MATEVANLNTWDYHVWGAMLGRYQKYTAKPTNIAELKIESCYRYGMICHMSSSIRQSFHFERDFVDKVLLQLVDILKTGFKYREGSRQSSLKQ